MSCRVVLPTKKPHQCELPRVNLDDLYLSSIIQCEECDQHYRLKLDPDNYGAYWKRCSPRYVRRQLRKDAT